MNSDAPRPADQTRDGQQVPYRSDFNRAFRRFVHAYDNGTTRQIIEAVNRLEPYLTSHAIHEENYRHIVISYQGRTFVATHTPAPSPVLWSLRQSTSLTMAPSEAINHGPTAVQPEGLVTNSALLFALHKEDRNPVQHTCSVCGRSIFTFDTHTPLGWRLCEDGDLVCWLHLQEEGRE